MGSELDKKERVWDEINSLVHIGRSEEDIRQTLSKMGYDESTLNRILTNSFMKRIIQKEQGFVELQRSANNQAMQQANKEENEALKQKSQERQAQKQRMQKDFLIQHAKEEDKKQKQKEMNSYDQNYDPRRNIKDS